MEEPLKVKEITVVIPMYNAENTIERALSSVVNQSQGNFLVEIIVVNDGSKDRSREVVENFIIQHKDFKINLINQSNAGVSKARNTGLRGAMGDYIALLDSDDAWLPEKLAVQIDCLEKNRSIDFLGASFDGLGIRNKLDGELSKISFKDLLFKNYFQPSTIIFKKEVLSKIGYFEENQRYAEEGNYFMRVAREFNCFFLNKKLIIFGDGKAGFGESGLSANLKEMEKGELQNLRFAYKNDWISTPLYIFTVGFSILKYIRRILIVKMR